MSCNLSPSASCNLSAGQSVTSVPLTFSCLFRPTELSRNSGLISLESSANISQFILYNSTTRLSFFVRNSAGTFGQAQVTAATPLNTWNHACAITTGSASRTVYLNAANSGTDTTNVSPSAIDITRIGAINSQSLNGLIAEVGIWSEALNISEITALSKGFTPDKIRPQSLVFYAPLIRNFIEIKGSLTLTNNNSATVADHPRIYG